MSSLSRYSAITLLLSVAFLVGLGLIMLGSTSPWAEPERMQYSHLKKQITFIIIGIFAATAAGFTPPKFYEKFVIPAFIFCIIALALCFIPGIGHSVNGSSRWVGLPGIPIRFQPSEPAKIVTSMILAWWMVRHAQKQRSFFRDLLPTFIYPGLILAIPTALILMEIDMGTTAVIIGSAFLLFYIGGTRGWLLGTTIIIGVAALIFLVQEMGGNRAERLLSFRDLEATKLSYGLQQWRSLLAFANGGIDGVGLGNGAEKHGYLPFAHTDFIYPIIGEELGLRFTLSVILSFVLIAVSGILISHRTQDRFCSLLAIGLTANIVIPGAMNIAVATAMLPNTGLPLPFVSYGGTNIVFTLISVGLLISIFFRVPKEEKKFVTTKRSRKVMRL